MKKQVVIQTKTGVLERSCPLRHSMMNTVRTDDRGRSSLHALSVTPRRDTSPKGRGKVTHGVVVTPRYARGCVPYRNPYNHGRTKFVPTTRITTGGRLPPLPLQLTVDNEQLTIIVNIDLLTKIELDFYNFSPP